MRRQARRNAARLLIIFSPNSFNFFAQKRSFCGIILEFDPTPVLVGNQDA
jgi:hypothetical protein